jgi:hypothetical protein
MVLESERRSKAMTLHQRPLSKALPAASPTPPGQGRWSWQRVAQGIWIVLALVLLVGFMANLPAFFQYAKTVCTLPNPGDCPTDQLTPIYVRVLDQLHLPVAVTAVLLAALTLAASVLYWLVGLLIFWRKSQEWMGLFVSLLLVMWGAAGLGGFMVTAQTAPLLQLLTNIISAVIGPALFVFLFTFPTGRFTPRWTLAVFVPVFVVNALSSLPLTAPFIPSIVVGLTYPLPVVVQVYRYVRIYDAVQRQQTKWFVFGVSVVISLLSIEGVLGVLAPGSPWYQLFNGPMWLLVWTVLLLSVSIPILRYRLWDIDVIINRTLIYGSLTVLLVAIYIGLILALQALVHAVTGSLSQQPLVIVASTLVIAALFQPLHRHLQTLIDRRFYRHKYDAVKVMAAFNSTLRNEVDLDQLREQLLTVVTETMQPSHVSLWVRKPTRTSSSSPQIGKPSSEEAGVREEIAGHGV